MAHAKNRDLVDYINWTLEEDDPAEITEDDKSAEVLRVIMTARAEFQSVEDDAFKTIYRLRTPEGRETVDFAFEMVDIANRYSQTYGAEAYDSGEGIVSIVRYKSELGKLSPQTPEDTAGTEESEEVAE